MDLNKIFNKNKSKKDIEKNIETIKDKIIENNKHKPKKKFLNILNEGMITYKSLACGVHNNQYYFGAVYVPSFSKKEKYTAIITSNNQIYFEFIKDEEKNIINEIINKFKLHYKNKLSNEYDKKRWSKESIQKWINKEHDLIQIDEIFEIVLSLLKKYIDHEDERVYDYIAIDIISTYFMPLFKSKGRTIITGPPASGKTTLCEIYELLCFNAIKSPDFTAPSFYNFVENNSATLIVDNFDRTSPEFKRWFLQFVESFYKKGNKRTKMGGISFDTVEYVDAFTHIVINSIDGIDGSQATESRLIYINMKKSANKNILSNEIYFDDEIWQEVKDKLHICALQNWGKIQKVYSSINIPEFSGRELEKVKANLIIAKLISNETYKSLCSYFKENDERNKIVDNSTNINFLICEYLFKQEFNDDNQKVLIYTREITEKQYKLENFPEMSKSTFNKKVGSFLKRNHPKNCEHVPSKHKGSAYKFSKEGIKRIIIENGFEFLYEKDENELDVEVIDYDEVSGVSSEEKPKWI